MPRRLKAASSWTCKQGHKHGNCWACNGLGFLRGLVKRVIRCNECVDGFRAEETDDAD